MLSQPQANLTVCLVMLVPFGERNEAAPTLVVTVEALHVDTTKVDWTEEEVVVERPRVETREEEASAQAAIMVHGPIIKETGMGNMADPKDTPIIEGTGTLDLVARSAREGMEYAHTAPGGGGGDTLEPVLNRLAIFGDVPEVAGGAAAGQDVGPQETVHVAPL